MDAFARAAALARCPVLARVPAAAVLAIAGRGVAIEVAAGAALPVRTDAGDAVLVVVDGEVGSRGATLGPGALIGELAAIDEDAAVAEAVAITDVVVVRLFRDDFLDLLAEHAVAADALARDLAQKLKTACGSGGTLKDGVIEVQGDHSERVIGMLKEQGHTVKRAGG
jgi:CRP-like cAMP-binding protein